MKRREQDAIQCGWAVGQWRLLAAFCTLMALPMLFSPTHPVAVYGYLADMYTSPLTPKAFAYSSFDMEAFLLSPDQVKRYRRELVEDALDDYTGKLFAIVREPDGALCQKPIRTWNGLVPRVLPAFLSAWLDRKELPFLGDEVELWLQGYEIIAMGHYHPFGGPPSPGDSAAQYLSHLPEVVIVNGLVPMVYLNGDVLVYGTNVAVTEEVYRSMRGLQGNLVMDPNQEVPIGTEPTPGLRSYLGYLRDNREVDISSREAIARDTLHLCEEFKESNSCVFSEGYVPEIIGAYDGDQDRLLVIANLRCITMWGTAGWFCITSYDVAHRKPPPINDLVVGVFLKETNPLLD
ncbi:MAG: hypothetical protein IT365_22810 [Candidatus Hydrogenedentes bacterium]|nr:hypothetical protein [Candidatus Hydrogenedentota bacterium]